MRHTAIAKDFPWSKEVFEKLEKYRSSNLKAVLTKISGHATLAYALGIGEWVARAFEGRSDCRRTLQYIEAAWAAMIDRRYLAKKQIEHVDYTWTDRDKDVITFVNHRLSFAYFHCKNLTPERFGDVAELTAVARHVASEKEPFETWSKRVLARLVELYPQPKVLGPPVPRDVLDVDRPLLPDEPTARLNAFVKDLVPESNEFLASAESLQGIADFTGRPYQAIGS